MIEKQWPEEYLAEEFDFEEEPQSRVCANTRDSITDRLFSWGLKFLFFCIRWGVTFSALWYP
jgi:hypothetical protein